MSDQLQVATMYMYTYRLATMSLEAFESVLEALEVEQCSTESYDYKKGIIVSLYVVKKIGVRSHPTIRGGGGLTC